MAEEQENKGTAAAPSGKGLGKRQKEEASLASQEDLKDSSPLANQEGVGEVEAYVNPKHGDAVEVNQFEEDGSLKSSETFEAGKLHLVSQELADSDLFISVEEYENR